VKIYLLQIDQERYFFYADVSESSDDASEGNDTSSPPGSGLRGWLHDCYSRFKSAWQHADSGAMLWMRRAWDWLHSLTRPDEAMLARLRSARRIDLHHPAARTGDEVRAAWRRYLNYQWRRHLFWMSINGAIAPIAFLLFVLPGPNLIGYWFAYRAIHHLLVVWGIRRVWLDRLATELHPAAALDRPLEPDEGGQACHAALAGAADQLQEHVEWHDAGRRARGARWPPVTASPTAQEPAHDLAEESRDL
jgi:hypothetical protein